MTWWCKCLQTCTCITLPDRYSCESSDHLPLRNVIFSFCFVFLTHSCLFDSPHLAQTSRQLSTKWFVFLAFIWHISASRLAFTSHVVKFVHCNTNKLSWPLSEIHLGLRASVSPNRKPLPRSILHMYWYVSEPFSLSILHRWTLDHCPQNDLFFLHVFGI